jgi:hypothetical protein
MVLKRTEPGITDYIYFSRDGVKGELCDVMKEPFEPSEKDKGIMCNNNFEGVNIEGIESKFYLIVTKGGRARRRHKKTMKRIRKTTKRIRKTTKRIRKTIKKYIRKTMKRK